MSAPFAFDALGVGVCQFANGWGWVVEIRARVSGSAHPLEKSAPDVEAQAYIACILGERTFEGSVPLRSQYDRRNVHRNASETVLL